ncbi:Zinc finger CCCH domain-containing protein 32 [Zostera marina]|uniref:Zinc finger CCCH domain-containing protein 32 n=1 Tax=Zostera marina TaxID=29655 RepID=A0A0K9PVF3_ZOSMR|nr:Zinc finger CCCH domain-containing protein 32 [Zostera marina]
MEQQHQYQYQQKQMYSRNLDPQTGLEESMWQLRLAGSGVGPDYPERPGEPDCSYFIKTGTCGYGDRCRFNHPHSLAAVTGVTRSVGEFPERIGQPLCQYFMRTGTCKFGSTCKYHHPKQGGLVTLNVHGYPLRPIHPCWQTQGEQECSYYIKSGQCKFGVTCKFNHPQPAGASVPQPAPTFYPTAQSSPIHSPHPYSTIVNWPVATRPQLLPGPSYMQTNYGHMIMSPGFVPVSGWNPYPGPVSSVVSPGGQTVQAGSIYGSLPQQLSASAPAYHSPYPLVSTLAGPSSSSQKEQNFPENPGQPECQFYMRTGDCKFGQTCRYHHPPEWSIPKTTCALSPIGLPLRPGAPSCIFYAQHGICKFGPTCKFNHPMEVLRNVSSETHIAPPHTLGMAMPILPPSPSSSALRPEFFVSSSNQEAFSSIIPLNGTSSASVGSIFSTAKSPSQSSPTVSAQNSDSLSSISNTMGQGGVLSCSS